MFRLFSIVPHLATYLGQGLF